MQDTATLRVRRDRSQFALLAKGFRPFFLLAAIAAVTTVPVWLLVLTGHVDPGSYLVPTYWHAHEMVFGFALAVVAGFLLTASANWTKRETATGGLLLALCLLWTAARVTMLLGGVLPAPVIAVANLLFLPALGLTLGRVLIGTSNRRNYGILVVIGSLFATQLLVHLDALGVLSGWQRRGNVVGVDLVILLVLIIAGRVVPLFTRNATGVERIGSLPWLDRGAILAMAALTVLDAIGGAASFVVAGVAGAAALLSAGRMARWGSRHSLREPLLWVLHLGYAFVPLGLGLRAVAALTPAVTEAVAIHALTIGGIGTLTLGMMTRVSLGHTGRPLGTPRLMGIAFALVALAAVARMVGALMGGAWYLPSLHSSGGLWTLAFALYLIRLGPILLVSRPDGRPG